MKSILTNPPMRMKLFARLDLVLDHEHLPLHLQLSSEDRATDDVVVKLLKEKQFQVSIILMGVLTNLCFGNVHNFFVQVVLSKK